MDHEWIVLISSIVVLTVSVLLTGIIIPQILLIAFRKNLFDEIDGRKIHRGPVPRLGGFAFLPAILFSLGFVVGFSIILGDMNIVMLFVEKLKGISFSLCAVLIMYLVGMSDDLVGVKYRAKFMAQILSAAFIIAGGLYIPSLSGLFGIGELPLWCSYLLTGLVFVFIVNAINLIDGIDGLASGMSSVALIFYAYLFFHMGKFLYMFLAMASLGALLPFFYFNVFGDANKHKKIFMGDTGALIIGTVLSILAIRVSGSDLTDIGFGSPLVVAFAPLIVPGLDVVRVFLHRMRAGRSPFLPDRTHIHHKFLALGLTPRLAMCSVMAVFVVFSIANIFCSRFMNINVLVLGNLIVWVAFNILLTRAIYRRQSKLNLTKPLYE